MSTPISKVVEPFAALGRALDADFRRAGYAEEAFTALAMEHVVRARLHEAFDLIELARWAMLTSELPRQEDLRANFGQPPLTVFSSRRFFISVLVWRSSTTTIHQHAFTGAFQVLKGGSMHACYRFEPRAWLSENLGFGTLRCTSAERLVRGDVRPIERATRGIHSLFHLEHPSISMVVRTRADQRFPIQYDYLRPGIAAKPSEDDDEQQVRTRQLVHMLLRTDRVAAESLLLEFLEQAVASDVFKHLSRLAETGDLKLSLTLLEAVHERFGEHSTMIEAALREMARDSFLTTRREAVRDPDLRYFLATLLNASTRLHACKLASAYTQERAAEDTLTGWLEALTTVKLKLQAGGLPWEPNVFGLPESDAASLVALRHALAGEAVAAEQSLPFYHAVRNDLVFAPLFRNE